MANRLVAAIAGIFLALTVAISAQAPPKGSGTLEVLGPVRVIDGDTFEVYTDGRQIAIGIIGIKVPRSNSPCGRKAAEFTQDLVNAVNGSPAQLKLRFEEDEVQTFDARKRRMYYLRLPNGGSAAAALVSAGLAEPDGTGAEREELAVAAAQATKCRG